MNIQISPFFLPVAQRQLFCLHLYPTSGAVKGNILYVHPFAEEMHKSRRMAALQARRFAEAGYRVLQVDLTGCGDSSGDFGDATWLGWCDDVKAAAEWLQQQHPAATILWGLRTGASVAVSVAAQLTYVHKLLLWQPVVAGELFITQFLRIKLASEMMSDGQAQTNTKQLTAQLQAGQGIEVGGYMLSPDMATQLGAFKLANVQPSCPVLWLELAAENKDVVTPASTRVIEAWRAAGLSVTARTLQGDPFWGVQEIAECTALLDTSMEVCDVA